MDSAPSLSPLETISANLRMVLRGLLSALGAWRIEPAIALVTYSRISGTFRRIERMLLRFRAGRLWRVTQRGAVSGRRTPGKPSVVLPRRFGWLVQASRQQAVCFGLQLQAVLNTPELTELLAASAQARRVLRPLCRALAVELPWTVDKPRAVTPRKPRKPRPKPEPFRTPLPRGVLSAARRHKELEKAIMARDALVLKMAQKPAV